MTISSENEVRRELQTVENNWTNALVQNDADRIARFMSDDWVIIGPQGNVIDRARFLGVIKSGDLSHSAMTSDDCSVRLYGDTALVSAQTRSAGNFKGQAFATHERATSVFVRANGQWQCILTQLTPITDHG